MDEAGKFGWRTLLQRLFTVVLACSALTSCATGPALTDHAFSFDAVRESPTAEVLDYRYGNSKQPGARPPDWVLRDGQISPGMSTSGLMLRGDSLYVKWRIKDTGQVHEDTVDLKSRLPANITDHRIHFVIRGQQLYVYLISPTKNPGNCPSDLREAARTGAPGDRVFRMYCDLKIYTLYPDQPASK